RKNNKAELEIAKEMIALASTKEELDKSQEFFNITLDRANKYETNSYNRQRSRRSWGKIVFDFICIMDITWWLVIEGYSIIENGVSAQRMLFLVYLAICFVWMDYIAYKDLIRYWEKTE
ncbi:MAG: hypothetical protein ACOYIK_08985, partial [Coriobacteriales bacterium]